MDLKILAAQLKKFFREDSDEIIGAYFDGEKIFVVRPAENFEAAEIFADGAEPEKFAEKISLVCAQKNWKASAVGFCLRERDAVTLQTDVANVPEKDFPAMVESWSRAQAGIDAVNSFVKVDGGLWMETLPRSRVDEICAAFRKVGLNLTALSVMPSDLLTKRNPLERARFIADVAANKTSPNFLHTRRGMSLDAKKISAALAIIFLVWTFVRASGIFADWYAAANELDAANLALNELRDDMNLKKFFDEDIDALRRLNNLTVAVTATKTFGLLINLGKVATGDVHLTTFRADENSAEVNGRATNAEAVKLCLARVKNSVTKAARLENSSAGDDGEITFAIRADLKTD